MTNLEKYEQLFMNNFKLKKEDLPGLMNCYPSSRHSKKHK